MKMPSMSYFLHIFLLLALVILPMFQCFRAFKFAVRKGFEQRSSCDDFDVAIVGAGVGGLSSAAILSSVYKLRVVVLESHSHPGGCIHSFPIKAKSSGATYLFDAGPTILLGCSSQPYNPLRQVLNTVGAGDAIKWIDYNSWGMVTEAGPWNFDLGPGKFEAGPLKRFAGDNAVAEFRALRAACEPLVRGAATIPTKALRGDNKLLPLLPYWSSLKDVIPYADTLDGSFESLMAQHVTDPWLQKWLDALAFSLSGLPAAKTGAAAMAYTLYDLHKDMAALNYPQGGMGKIADVLVDIIRQTGSEVHLSSPVEGIITEGREDNLAARGVVLKSGKVFRTQRGVICNCDIWSLPKLVTSSAADMNDEQRNFFLRFPPTKPATKSFLHLHLGLDATGLNVGSLQPHYTVMEQGLATADPCGDRNMVAVSNPSVLDSSLIDQSGKLMIHAYGAGNEDFANWERFAPLSSDSFSPYSSSATTSSVDDYKAAKAEACKYLYRSVGRALGVGEDEVRERAEVRLEGTPLTHRRYLARHKGTYGAAWGAMLEGPMTPMRGLLLCGDSVFPGIGVPAVALSGSIAANSLVPVTRHLWELLMSL